MIKIFLFLFLKGEVKKHSKKERDDLKANITEIKYQYGLTIEKDSYQQQYLRRFIYSITILPSLKRL